MATHFAALPAPKLDAPTARGLLATTKPITPKERHNKREQNKVAQPGIGISPPERETQPARDFEQLEPGRLHQPHNPIIEGRRAKNADGHPALFPPRFCLWPRHP